ncbi:MAG: hypothetical protein ABIQ89_02115 [Candidatus Saccharimonadales bacterium]
MAEVGVIHEQATAIGEQFQELRYALATDPDFTHVDAGMILAEHCVISAMQAGGVARKRAVEVGEELAWRGVEAFRNGLGLYAVIRASRNPLWEDSLGFLATAVTFNATQELLDKHGRNGDV